ncbi:hypothetical protein ABZP36_006949, partial [Zizania latifolia]
EAATARRSPMAAPSAHASMGAGHAGRSSSSTSSISTRSRSNVPSVSGGADDAGAPPYPEQSEGKILEAPNLRIFTFAELKAATRNFKPDTVLGEGGFGRVYKGWVDEKTMNPARSGTGMVIAVKKLNPESVQGLQEWQVRRSRCLQRRLIRKLEKFINNCGRGLNLHRTIPPATTPRVLVSSRETMPRVHAKLHDIVLIVLHGYMQHYNAKLSDFGLAKNGPTGGDSHVTTRVLGTYGYAAPEYVATGHLYVKSDVYGFGVVLLEMLTGLRALDTGRPAPQHSLVDWAKPYLADRRRLARLVDPRLEGQCPSRAALQAAQLTLRCLSGDPKSRPSMAEVVAALEEIERIKARPKAAPPASREDASPRVFARSGGHVSHAHGHGHHRHHSPRPRSASDGARSGHPSPRVR